LVDSGLQLNVEIALRGASAKVKRPKPAFQNRPKVRWDIGWRNRRSFTSTPDSCKWDFSPIRSGAAKTARESAPRGRYFCTHAAARRLRDKRKTEPSGPVLGLRQFHARARGSIVSRCFLRSANFLLQNYAIRRNATKITLGYCPPLKNTLCNTAKNCASPSLWITNQLPYLSALSVTE